MNPATNIAVLSFRYWRPQLLDTRDSGTNSSSGCRLVPPLGFCNLLLSVNSILHGLLLDESQLSAICTLLSFGASALRSLSRALQPHSLLSKPKVCFLPQEQWEPWEPWHKSFPAALLAAVAFECLGQKKKKSRILPAVLLFLQPAQHNQPMIEIKVHSASVHKSTGSLLNVV